MDGGPPGSSVYGTLQAGILEWVAMPSSRDLPHLGIEPASPALAGAFWITSATREGPASSAALREHFLVFAGLSPYPVPRL